MKESTTSTISEIQEDVVQDISTTPATNSQESEKNLSLDDTEMVRLLCKIAFVFHKFRGAHQYHEYHHKAQPQHRLTQQGDKALKCIHGLAAASTTFFA